MSILESWVTGPGTPVILPGELKANKTGASYRIAKTANIYLAE